MNFKAKKMAKKGQTGLQGTVGSLVVVGILLIIGVYVFAKVGASIDQTGLTAAQNATIENVKSTTLDAFELSTVALIVLAAVAIIAILFNAFRA